MKMMIYFIFDWKPNIWMNFIKNNRMSFILGFILLKMTKMSSTHLAHKPISSFKLLLNSNFFT